MALPLYVVDAFTADAFGGNPAGVVLGHGDERWMQRVAAEMKHSETAFVAPRPDGGFDLRWFTPEVEVDLCGHATLASAHVLFEYRATRGRRGRRLPHAQWCAPGDACRARAVTLDFPVAVPRPETGVPQVFDALGIEPTEFLRTDGEFFLCVVDDADAVRTLQPDFGRLRDLTNVRGVYVSAPGDGEPYDIVSRCFAPRVGIDEDPVTGSMHCVLVAYWGPRLGRTALRAYQASPRGGAADGGARRRPRVAHRRSGDGAGGRATRVRLERDATRAARAIAFAQRDARLPPEHAPRPVDRAAVAERVAGLRGAGRRPEPARPRARRRASMRSRSVISPPPARLHVRAGRDVARRPRAGSPARCRRRR